MIALSTPSRGDVDSWLDALDREEPQARTAIWRPAFEKLSTGLHDARRIRNVVRVVVAAIVVGLVVLLHSGPWSGTFVRDLFGIGAATAMAVEFALAKVFPVLDREQRIVAALRYFGSSVADEEVFS